MSLVKIKDKLDKDFLVDNIKKDYITQKRAMITLESVQSKENNSCLDVYYGFAETGTIKKQLNADIYAAKNLTKRQKRDVVTRLYKEPPKVKPQKEKKVTNQTSPEQSGGVTKTT